MCDDDTALSCASKSTTDVDWNINEDLVYLNKYFVINKLCLNIQKGEFLTIRTQQHLKLRYKFKDVNINVDEIDIVKVTTSIYLAIIID